VVYDRFALPDRSAEQEILVTHPLGLETRVQRLESQLRRSRVATGIALLALGVVGLASMQSPAQPTELRAERVVAKYFSLVDETGRERGYFGPVGNRGPDVTAVSLTLFGPPNATSHTELKAWAGVTGAELNAQDSAGPSEAVVCASNDSAEFTVRSAPPTNRTGQFNVASLLGRVGRGELLVKDMSAEPGSTDPSATPAESTVVRIRPDSGVVKSRD
jgi:hypothetical protein